MDRMDVLPGPSAGRLFRVWVRRRLDATSLFELRFEVSGGKGFLRVTRPGVLIDPPARQAGAEAGLTVAQLRAARFLVSREGGRGRVTHLLSRVDDLAIERLPLDTWIELQEISEGGGRYLQLPVQLPLVDTDSPVDETTSPQRMLEELREELSNPRLAPILEGAGSDAAERHVGPVAVERGVEAAVPPAPAADLEMADWAGTFEVRESVASTPAVVEMDEVSEPIALAAPDDAAAVDEAPVLVDGAAAGSEAAPGEPDVTRFHQRTTTLVRYLRRKIATEEGRVRLLEAQVRALEAKSGTSPG